MLVNTLARTWAGISGIAAVRSEPSVDEWLRKVRAADPQDVLRAAVVGPPQLVASAVQALLARGRAAAESSEDAVAVGELICRIVRRGHGTGFDGGNLAAAHGHFLAGIEGHLSQPADARLEYERATLAYINQDAPILAQVAGLAAATVGRTLLADGDDSEVRSALEDLHRANPATAIALDGDVASYVELAIWIAHFHDGAGTAPHPPIDHESSQMLAVAALEGWDRLEVSLALARLADAVSVPPRPSARQRLAERLALRRRWPEAASVLEELHGEDPSDTDVLEGLASAYSQIQRWPEARDLLLGAIHDPPDSRDLSRLRLLVALAYEASDEGAARWRHQLAMLGPDADPFAGLPAPSTRRPSPQPLAVLRDGSLQLDPDLLDLPQFDQQAHISAAIIVGSPDGDSVMQDLVDADPAAAERVRALLDVYSQSADRIRAAELFNAAETDFAAGRFDEAERGYVAALELDPEFAEAATYLGDTWYRRGELHTAQAFFEESLAIEPTAQAYRFLGDCLYLGGHGKRRAREAYLQALELSPDYAGARQALARLGSEDQVAEAPSSPDAPPPDEEQPRDRAQAQPPATPTSSARSSDVPATTADMVRRLESTGKVGDNYLAAYVRSGGPERAELVAAVDDDAAFDAWLATASVREVSMFLMLAISVGFQYHAKDRDASSWRQWVERQLAAAESLPRDYGAQDDPLGLGRDRHLANALQCWGEVRDEAGELGEARALYEQALASLDAEAEARSRAGLVGDSEYDQAFTQVSVRGNLLEKLARLCERVGDHAAAIHYRKEASRANEGSPTVEREVTSFVGRGHSLLDEGRVNDALGAFQHAVYLAEDDDPDPLVPRMLTMALNGLGDGCYRAGAMRAALGHFDRARTLNERTGNADRLAFDHRAIARVLEKQPALADDVVGDAREHLERALTYASVPTDCPDSLTWSDTRGKLLRITSPERAWPTLLQLASHLSSAGDDAAAVGYLDMATQIAEVVRAGVFDEDARIAVRRDQALAFNALASAHVRLVQHGIDPATHARAAWIVNESLRARTFLDALGDAPLRPPSEVPDDLIDREDDLLRRRRELRESARSDVAFWRDYHEVTGDLDVLWSHIQDSHPTARAYVEIRQAAPADPDDLTDLLRGERRPTVLVDITRTDDGALAAIALRADHDDPVVSSVPADLARMERFIDQSFGSAGTVRELATDLEDLFQHELSPVRELLTSVSDPDDVLVVSPFGRLHHIPLGALRYDGQVLLERNPLVLLPSSSVIRALRSAAHERPELPAAVFGDPTGDLRGARAEADAVARRFGVTPDLTEKATVGAVRTALSRAGIVHVAGHAEFDAEDPLASGLRLADGRLTARDILDVRAPALSLMTLSACETGVSRTDAAEELIGLTRALLFAGADAIVVSLWKVPDKPTQHIMEGIYDALGDYGSPADAIRRAVLSGRETFGPTRFDTWAAFQLVGDWRPISTVVGGTSMGGTDG